MLASITVPFAFPITPASSAGMHSCATLCLGFIGEDAYRYKQEYTSSRLVQVARASQPLAQAASVIAQSTLHIEYQARLR